MMRMNEYNIQSLKKIKAMIPEKLFLEIVKLDLFDSNFDQFITNAIAEAIKKKRELK